MRDVKAYLSLAAGGAIVVALFECDCGLRLSEVLPCR